MDKTTRSNDFIVFTKIDDIEPGTIIKFKVQQNSFDSFHWRDCIESRILTRPNELIVYLEVISDGYPITTRNFMLKGIHRKQVRYFNIDRLQYPAWKWKHMSENKQKSIIYDQIMRKIEIVKL